MQTRVFLVIAVTVSLWSRKRAMTAVSWITVVHKIDLRQPSSRRSGAETHLSLKVATFTYFLRWFFKLCGGGTFMCCVFEAVSKSVGRAPAKLMLLPCFSTRTHLFERMLLFDCTITAKMRQSSINLAPTEWKTRKPVFHLHTFSGRCASESAAVCWWRLCMMIKIMWKLKTWQTRQCFPFKREGLASTSCPRRSSNQSVWHCGNWVLVWNLSFPIRVCEKKKWSAQSGYKRFISSVFVSSLTWPMSFIAG